MSLLSVLAISTAILKTASCYQAAVDGSNVASVSSINSTFSQESNSTTESVSVSTPTTSPEQVSIPTTDGLYSLNLTSTSGSLTILPIVPTASFNGSYSNSTTVETSESAVTSGIPYTDNNDAEFSGVDSVTGNNNNGSATLTYVYANVSSIPTGIPTQSFAQNSVSGNSSSIHTGTSGNGNGTDSGNGNGNGTNSASYSSIPLPSPTPTLGMAAPSGCRNGIKSSDDFKFRLYNINPSLFNATNTNAFLQAVFSHDSDIDSRANNMQEVKNSVKTLETEFVLLEISGYFVPDSDVMYQFVSYPAPYTSLQIGSSGSCFKSMSDVITGQKTVSDSSDSLLSKYKKRSEESTGVRAFLDNTQVYPIRYVAVFKRDSDFNGLVVSSSTGAGLQNIKTFQEVNNDNSGSNGSDSSDSSENSSETSSETSSEQSDDESMEKYTVTTTIYSNSQAIATRLSTLTATNTRTKSKSCSTDIETQKPVPVSSQNQIQMQTNADLPRPSLTSSEEYYSNNRFTSVSTHAAALASASASSISNVNADLNSNPSVESSVSGSNTIAVNGASRSQLTKASSFACIFAILFLM